MTEEEAKKKVENFPKEPTWFCPLINAQCNPDCWCYIEARAVIPYPSSKDWRADKAYCDNAMFSEKAIQY